MGLPDGAVSSATCHYLIAFLLSSNLLRSDLDMLSTFETAGAHVLASQAPTRYAVRQVLDQELHKTKTLRENAARQARFSAGNALGNHDVYDFDDKENQASRGDTKTKRTTLPTVKKDFFGRIIQEASRPLQDLDGNALGRERRGSASDLDANVWVTFHEGLNNAVRKPISLQEFLRGL